MQLTVAQDDADLLLTEKNALALDVLDKYRAAGHVAQTTLRHVLDLINDSYHLNKQTKLSAQELCLAGDSMAFKLIARQYNDTLKVQEKGMAQPTTIEFNEHVGNVLPELDLNAPPVYFQPGDVITISVGAHFDGYTAMALHSCVIFPPGVEIDGELKPEGPLLGAKADAVVASYIATEALVALLGLALTPDKIGAVPGLTGNSITGSQIRRVVDGVAESFGCVVAPGSKVRRVRRFLAGQAEGIVAERDFKGVVWTESDQEALLLQKLNTETQLIKLEDKFSSSAVPDDDFVVEAGEVYNIDIRMCSVSGLEMGLVTMQEIDEFADPLARPSVFIRDHAITHQLRLKSARHLISEADKRFSVYPFKLLHMCEDFPVESDLDYANIKKQLSHHRLGLKELLNRYLVRTKPVQIVKHVPFSKILNSANPTGRHGIDASKLHLPGREIPLPALGVSGVKLKSLLKYGSTATNVARESCTVVLNSIDSQVVQISGGSSVFRPSWVHSQYQVTGDVLPTVQALSALVEDSKFGIRVKQIQPYKLGKEDGDKAEMQID